MLHKTYDLSALNVRFRIFAYAMARRYCTLNVYFLRCKICCCFDTQSIRNQLLTVNDTKCSVLRCTVSVPVRTGYDM